MEVSSPLGWAPGFQASQAAPQALPISFLLLIYPGNPLENGSAEGRAGDKLNEGNCSKTTVCPVKRKRALAGSSKGPVMIFQTQDHLEACSGPASWQSSYPHSAHPGASLSSTCNKTTCLEAGKAEDFAKTKQGCVSGLRKPWEMGGREWSSMPSADPCSQLPKSDLQSKRRP